MLQKYTDGTHVKDGTINTQCKRRDAQVQIVQPHLLALVGIQHLLEEIDGDVGAGRQDLLGDTHGRVVVQSEARHVGEETDGIGQGDEVIVMQVKDLEGGAAADGGVDGCYFVVCDVQQLQLHENVMID